eukprot:gb/GECG01007121.1/.p1 GENE.gb/GECG01007121.1/~~gb/GECG01007121.1/.p1  ORF type:complete len:466 (+),score=39.97 gb/GECG01007121.1/:1-1398(+)
MSEAFIEERRNTFLSSLLPDLLGDTKAIDAAGNSENGISSKEFAMEVDQKDPFRKYRDEFEFPETGEEATIREPKSRTLYFCGNSLGLQPKRAREYLNEELDKWATYGVEGHFKTVRPWVTVDETVKDQMAAVVGAKPLEVTVMNSLTANLHLMMVPFYRPEKSRFKILIEEKAFPSDYQAVCSQLQFHGYDPEEALIKVQPREDGALILSEDIVDAIERRGDEIALVLIGGVQYYTGQFFDIPSIVQMAHNKGCNVGIDLAHAVGNVPLELHDWGPDFACWCTYKYLNSGPGSIGGCFVHEKHANRTDLPRFAGWWGHQKDDRFKMEHKFVPSPGAAGYQLSNPPVLECAVLRASLNLFIEAGGVPALREKSLALTSYLELLLSMKVPGIQIVTPAERHYRGCQLSLRLPVNIKKVYETLQNEGIIVDTREPDTMRVAPCPLYNSFSDVQQFVEILAQVISNVK